jgi:hypothetical protein
MHNSDAILDCIVNQAHRIEMMVESICKRNKKSSPSIAEMDKKTNL